MVPSHQLKNLLSPQAPLLTSTCASYCFFTLPLTPQTLGKRTGSASSLPVEAVPQEHLASTWPAARTRLLLLQHCAPWPFTTDTGAFHCHLTCYSCLPDVLLSWFSSCLSLLLMRLRPGPAVAFPRAVCRALMLQVSPVLFYQSLPCQVLRGSDLRQSGWFLSAAVSRFWQLSECLHWVST